MSKYFKSIEEFNNWILEFRKKQMEKLGGDLFHQLYHLNFTEEDYVNGLVADGYTDLDNLVADGHAYQICGHKNNGWLYRDEVDKYFSNIPEERIRDRK